MRCNIHITIQDGRKATLIKHAYAYVYLCVCVCVYRHPIHASTQAFAALNMLPTLSMFISEYGERGKIQAV